MGICPRHRSPMERGARALDMPNEVQADEIVSALVLWNWCRSFCIAQHPMRPLRCKRTCFATVEAIENAAAWYVAQPMWCLRTHCHLTRILNFALTSPTLPPDELRKTPWPMRRKRGHRLLDYCLMSLTPTSMLRTYSEIVTITPWLETGCKPVAHLHCTLSMGARELI
jgi:hypothetical protein